MYKRQANDDDQITPQEFFTIRQNAAITKEIISSESGEHEDFRVVDGENLVFSYQKNDIDDPDLIDDETTNIIRFEIATDQNSFSFSDNELSQLSAYYDKVSFVFIPTTAITQGTISGVKIDDSNWDIMINVTIFSDFIGTARNFVVEQRFTIE